MNRLRVMVSSVFLLLLLTSTPLAQAPITAQTGDAILIGGAGLAVGMSEDEYRKEAALRVSRPSFLVIDRKPPRLTPAARFGFNFSFGGFNRGWIVDGDAAQGYTLYADLNGNRDLADDAPLRFTDEKGVPTLRIDTTAKETRDGREASYPVEIKIEVTQLKRPNTQTPQLALKIYNNTMRRGALRVGGRDVAFGLVGSQGIYDWQYNNVYFDLNGDGELDAKTPKSAEQYAVSEKYVNFGDQSYEFVVDRYGRSLTLKPMAEKLPARAVLQPGSAAPEFSFTDLDGKTRKLSDYRGKVVLLDFWGIWCGPCVAEAPKLAATYRQLREKGFEVIGVHLGDELAGVKKFIAEHGMSWAQTIEKEEGALHKLFRVDGWPTYFLIGKDGVIVANNLRPGAELIKEIEQQIAGK